ncbi:trypsin-like peptidase domain-containing protein [Pseudofrankia inefficax]|uniref:WD40 repeat, subgroup n=1 Tax=Pseudofrankia inefficax (strain DSM 45817 / CECT 9037 / DDB 130130 / EuI1c) TaxID=298654 RepID=E3IW98_PSEI1|nr:trypsin-like peptidase domain-containing protein [Pseudofrankia inefficax]ADP78940.1 WD40 repeat, subgroup [Pseudofrankia inefficax]
MAIVPLAVRVVEVIADRGAEMSPRYRYGSGCVVAGGWVLTAAHVVAAALGVVVRTSDKVVRAAALDPRFIGDVDGPGPDLALVSVVGLDLPPMGLAKVDRDSPTGDPVERCHAIGYPAFMERAGPDGVPVRDTVDAFGHIPALSLLAGGLLSLQVSSTPRPLPPERVAVGESEWSGMSGGPVVAEGFLVGVVTEHAPRAGSSALTLTPLTALQADSDHPGWSRGVTEPAGWWARLGVSGPGALRWLPIGPVGSARPAYQATVREIHRRTSPLVGRQRELADIASFAVGSEGYRCLVGGAWAGKTSLLAEAVVAALPPQVDVVSYFLSRREADADSARFLAAVVPQLAYLVGDQEPPTADLHQLRALWQRAVDRAAAQDRHLLLVVDGLDEDLRPPGLPSVAAVLPAGVGGRAHVLVASRPYPALPGDVPVGHPLPAVQPVEVEPFAGAQELAALARQEIDELTRDDETGLAADVLGLLAAAAGPLAIEDLTALAEVAPRSAALTRKVRRLLSDRAARSVQPVGPTGARRWQFAHESLLAHARTHDDLADPDFRRRIDRWADGWRDAGWPAPTDGGDGTPRYLLDSYACTLARQPQRLSGLAGDAGWVVAAIETAGADWVLADLRRAAAADPTHPAVAATLATVTGQAHQLRLSPLLHQPGYVARQLCLQAAELAEDRLAADLRTRLRAQPGPGLVPLWTTRRASPALAAELGRHDGPVRTMTALPDGRVATAVTGGRLLAWDPAAPDADPTELGRNGRSAFPAAVRAMAVLPDGRLATAGTGGRLLAWDPAAPGTPPTELGRHDHVSAMAVLPDGRLATNEYYGRLLLWDPTQPDAAPTQLGRHGNAVAALPDGRLVTSGSLVDGQLLVWDPATPGTGPIELGYGTLQAPVVLLDGRVAAPGFDGRPLLWDPAAPGADPTELGGVNNAIKVAAALPDGRLATGSHDGRVLVWDPTLPGTDPTELGRHDDEVLAMAVLPDGRLATGGGDGRVLLWDPTLPDIGPTELGRHDQWVLAVTTLLDGRLASGGADGRILRWDPARPSAGPTELGHGVVQAAAVLPDGRLATGNLNGPMLLWEPAAPGAGPTELGRDDTSVLAMAVLPDGRLATGGGDPRVLLWDPATPGIDPTELGRHDGPVPAMYTLATGNGPPIEVGRGNISVEAVAVLPDGRIVTGGTDGQVLLWDLTQPEAGPIELGRHDGPVRAVAVLPDGRIVTGGTDRRVLLWDPTAPGTEMAQLSCSVTTLATGPLGQDRSSLLVVAHQGSGISFWSVIGDQEI